MLRQEEDGHRCSIAFRRSNVSSGATRVRVDATFRVPPHI